MAEYIDREALLHDIEQSVVYTAREKITSAEMRGARKVIERIKCAPAVEPIYIHEPTKSEFKRMAVQLSYTRLRELAEADKAGRVVVSPCKVGDTVYEVTNRKTISEYRVKEICVELFCTFIKWDVVAGFVDKSIFGVSVDEIGKTVFLTREEAEKALEARKDGDKTDL
jgi:hypothetical protein